ncbi:hypothetical protein [Dictyobacter kobayashii]|uniref:GspE/PulE/PilB domain-containing protein n=1 Tax=Dictyobacter kobayashii TaxID=2014872 RepID=UPI000F834751|nr:hypothetical protein [Dictyobacter kobayashii]
MRYRQERKNGRPLLTLIEAVPPMPRLTPLRRVPSKYFSLLPLHMILRYQCIVVGKSKGSLTVAIADHKSLCVLPIIGHLTGCQVFPVIIDSRHMSLLLQRLERTEEERRWGRYRYADRVHVNEDCVFPSLHTMIQFLTSPSMKLYHREINE